MKSFETKKKKSDQEKALLYLLIHMVWAQFIECYIYCKTKELVYKQQKVTTFTMRYIRFLIRSCSRDSGNDFWVPEKASVPGCFQFIVQLYSRIGIFDVTGNRSTYWPVKIYNTQALGHRGVRRKREKRGFENCQNCVSKFMNSPLNK